MPEARVATLPSVRIGAHVKAGRGLNSALEQGAAIGAEVVQIHTQSPRMWRASQHSPEELRAYREVPVTQSDGDCHVLSCDLSDQPGDTRSGARKKSRASLAANLSTAQAIGAEGLVLHIGSHRGSGFEVARAKVAEALVEALEAVHDSPPLGETGTEPARSSSRTRQVPVTPSAGHSTSWHRSSTMPAPTIASACASTPSTSGRRESRS